MPAHWKCTDRPGPVCGAFGLLVGLWLCVSAPVTAATADAGCLLRLTGEPPELELVYDAFASAMVVRTTPLALENLGERPCRLVLEPLGAAAGRVQMPVADTAIQAELLIGNDRRGLQELTRGTPLQFEMAANGNQLLQVGARLQPGAFPRPGSYSHALPFALRDRDTGARVLDELLLRLRIEVPAHVQLNLAGSNADLSARNGGHVVDFGQLREGASRHLNLQIRANDAYQVSLRSENQGRLRRRESLDDGGIAYQMMVGGRSTDLVSPLEWSMPRPATRDGINLPVQIRIGGVTGYLAGTYEDVVHVSVMAHH